MKKTAAIVGLCFLTLVAVMTACRQPSADAAAVLLKTFADPPSSFRSVPLWVWNDAMTQDEVRTQLEDFKARGIGGVFIHPRPGLITPYLSPEWLSLCKDAVEAGKALGLEVWIYDENSYPSGFAGGHVPAQMPDAGRAGLRMTRFQGTPKSLDTPAAVVLRQTAGGFEDVTGKVPSKSTDNAVYYVFDVVHDKPSPWFGGYTYVDIMRKDVTEKFLDVTLNAYKGVIGPEFGGTVPGVFQDEAEISPAGGPATVNYTPALFQAFQTKWGYDLRTRLVSLFQDVGEWRRVRHNFYSTLLDLFIENWAKPYYAYCGENNLQFTGHYWDHAWPDPAGSPDNLAMAAYAHMPGVDILMNAYERGPHAQFGNDRAVREIRSAANQRGRTRTMSETYGASGWDLGFFDQKRIGDWEYALGVNFLNQHLSYATIKGARKRDHPLSFSYHEPWWKLYNTMADYFGRLSVAMSAGQQVNTVLVLEPTTSAWMKYAPGRENTDLEAMGADFQTFIHLLEAEHVEYDLASEKTLQEFGSVKNRKLAVGERSYSLLLLPPGLENLDNGTVTLLREYLMTGGKVISWVAPPDYIDGKATEDIRLLAASYGDRWYNSGPGNGIDKIRAHAAPKIVFSEPQNRPWLFHQRRELGGGQLVFLANVSPDQPSDGRMTVEGGSVMAWDLFTGRTKAVPFERRGGTLDIPFSLAPGGSLLLCVQEKKARPVAAAEYVTEDVAPSGEIAVARESANVLTLDYCDLVLGGKAEKDLYFYDAQKKIYAYHGLVRNPWDSAVQYKTNILDKDKFAPNSGFEATFWFTAVKADFFDFASIKAVVERPELFKVSVNGKDVQASPGEWWLDRAFGVYPIGPLVKAGRNRVTVRCRPFTIHSELEPVYILGDFKVEPAARGFELRPAGPLALGPWTSQGLPLYGQAVVYRRSFELPEAAPLAGRYVLKLGAWRGSVAEVRVGGRTAGVVLASPGEVDITDALEPGANEVSVAVYGSLRNTLGPFHNAPPKGSAWPGNFQHGAKDGVPPGAGYSILEYGMFDDLKLTRRVER